MIPKPRQILSIVSTLNWPPRRAVVWIVDTIKRVQDLMQARDMNLCVLAKKCGISYSTIQTTARRGGQLSVETIERICQGLGITLKDFFDSSYL